MKNILYILLVWVLFLSSCKPKFNDVVPNCDNTIKNFSISLDFSRAYYFCNIGNYQFLKPPLATTHNYTQEASQENDIVNVGNLNTYVCQVNSKNDQPTQTACNNPAVIKSYWKVPGYSQVVSVFSNYVSDITVDYYEPSDLCNTGRPYHVGKVAIPAGATSCPPITMYTQANWKP